MRIIKFIEQLKNNGLFVEDSGLGPNLNIKYISCDSRNICPGTCFFVKGQNFKAEYLDSAIKSGAVLYIAEKKYDNVDSPFVIVSDIRLAMPLCANLFYDISHTSYTKIGVTGTKGKTTTAYLLKNIFDIYNRGKVGLISTIEALSCGKNIKKTGTTPEALDFYGILNTFKKDRVKTAICEVSSQGLQYNRTAFLHFKYGIYLNLSPDHISPTEHSSFDEYKNAKKKLLQQSEIGLVNIDDPYSNEIMDSHGSSKLYTYGIEKPADFFVSDIKESPFSLSFTIHTKMSPEFKVDVPLAGHFNIYNILAAVSVAVLEKVPSDIIQKALKTISIPGRMDITEIKGRFLLVDYAHNLLSFTGLFDYAKEFFPDSKVIFLFGCQGNKALDRRIELPEIVGKRADFTILTSDDPAFEKPEDIIFEVETVLKKNTLSYESIVDREKAVYRAVEISSPGDLIILSGKGPETTQIVKGRYEPYIGDKNAALAAFDKYFR